MINAYHFILENLKSGFKINLESQNFIHANSILTTIPFYPDMGTETIQIFKTLNEMGNIYTRLTNQCTFNNFILFSAGF